MKCLGTGRSLTGFVVVSISLLKAKFIGNYALNYGINLKKYFGF